MPPGEQIALQPTMTEMFAQHLHHAPFGREMIIRRENRFHKTAVLYLKDVPQAIRVGFVRTKEAEIALPSVFRKDVPHHLPKLATRLLGLGPTRLDINRVVGK